MSVRSGTFYWLACDFEGCEVESKDEESGHVYGSEPDVLEHEIESMFVDEGRWAAVGDKHFCPKHFTYCDECGEYGVIHDPRLMYGDEPRLCDGCKAVAS